MVNIDNGAYIVNMRIIHLFLFLIGHFVLPSHTYCLSLFQTMATMINHQLFPTIVQPNDTQMQQLIRSVFSQLQNTTQTRDVGHVIDIILNVLKQHQNYSQDIGISLVVVVTAHSLRIIAQKLYRSISLIRKSLLYWKQVDQTSLFEYCSTHIPTIWDAKFNGGFIIKQKIVQAEKVYTLYVTQLGVITRLIHQLPKTVNYQINLAWINDALTIFKRYSLNQNTEISAIKPFDTVALLKHIKSFLGNFDTHYNKQFQTIKDAVGLPAYFSSNFGKILKNIAIVGGALFAAYYYNSRVGIWSKNLFESTKNYIWTPIYDNVKSFFSTTPKDLLMNEDKIKEQLELTGKKDVALQEKIKTLIPSESEKNELIKEIKELLTREYSQKNVFFYSKLIHTPETIHQEAEKIVLNNDYLALIDLIKKLANSRFYTGSAGSIVDYATNAYTVVQLLLQSLHPENLELVAFIYSVLGEVLKALHRLDTDLVLLRKIFILTPALLTIAGTYKAGSALYGYATRKDYSSLIIAFKELETVTICATNQPENDSSYGLFIFLLETLKIGVVQLLPSRYTERNQLLEDLKRLESPDLTFKQRLKLIEQIRKSYSIFKRS